MSFVKSVNHLFFDLDGPILDVSRKYYQLYADLVSTQGKQPIALAEYWEAKRQRIPDVEILRRSHLDHWTIEYQQLRKAHIETPAYLRYDRIWDGLLPVLQRLSTTMPLTLVTLRHSSDALHWQLSTLGLLPCFQRVLSGSGDQATGDKSTVKVKLVQEAWGDRAIAGWFIGDTETDIRTGQQLGLQTIAVSFGIRTVEQLRPLYPDLLIESPSSLIKWLTAHRPTSMLAQTELCVEL